MTRITCKGRLTNRLSGGTVHFFRFLVLQIIVATTLKFSTAWVPLTPMPSRVGKSNAQLSSTSLFLGFNVEENDCEARDKWPCQMHVWTKALAALCVSAAIMFSGPNFSLLEASAYDNVPVGQKYWSIMTEGGSAFSAKDRMAANEALLDYAVGMINTQFYDNTGGAFFAPRDFYSQWKLLKNIANGAEAPVKRGTMPTDIHLDTREGAVHAMKWLVGSLNDPFSKYLTREELQQELHSDSNGFLGTGAIVETPQVQGPNQYASFFGPQTKLSGYSQTQMTASFNLPKRNDHRHGKTLTITRVENLPVVTAVSPDSPAERAGIVVGDRIVAVGDQNFLGWTRPQVQKWLALKYNQQGYFGLADLAIAKPIYALPATSDGDGSILITPTTQGTLGAQSFSPREIVLGYRQTRVRIPVSGSLEPFMMPSSASEYAPEPTLVGGDAIVHYELLTSHAGSIFDRALSDDTLPDDYNVGYIRLTRFSKASTIGFVQAVQALEDAGAQAYILDLRNNYGGVIQEAMLTASTLLRDPHSVLCYIMNSRGGFTPHDAEEYIVDKRFPGYLLSSEPQTATIDQVRKENPEIFQPNGIDWDPPSSFASFHEQVIKRGIHRVSDLQDLAQHLEKDPILKAQVRAQKKIVVLINEGTASSAEVFVAALHDNARTVAVVGTKSYGKGLIQHTFPMPDGGGLRLTVAEYLTPSLSHVTNVGGARFDPHTGEFVGGGIRPDIVCESKQGIPGNIRADLCVGVALDALEEATLTEDTDDSNKMPSFGLVAGFPTQVLGNRGHNK